MVSAPDLQGRENFQTISMPRSYATCPGLSIKWAEGVLYNRQWHQVCMGGP